MDTKRKLSLGIMAHVDAGKTTLTEALLFASKSIRKLGRVDHRDTFLDTDVQERERGITIYSKTARVITDEAEITLIDTPGHTDFAGEAERVLSVLDAAILLVSAPDGVQGHTLTLWRMLNAMEVPVILFVNKMDMPGMEREKILFGIKKNLSPKCCDIEADEYQEAAAETDEAAMERYFETGSVDETVIRNAVSARKLFPVLFGSALKLENTDKLIEYICRVIEPKPYTDGFSARVYKIARDSRGERMALCKITGGELSVRSAVYCFCGEEKTEEKVSALRLYNGEKFTAVDKVSAGDVCAIMGLKKVIAGDTLGSEFRHIEGTLESVFRYRVLTEPSVDPHTLLGYLKTLEEEDPLIKVSYSERTREVGISVMGDVQLEILTRVLKDRFNVNASFVNGSILYKETIAGSVEGVGHYEPLRHYAEVHLLIEEAPRGSGITISSAVSVDDLSLNWQRLIFTHIAERRHAGVLTGSPLTDVKITLVAGKDHLKHTEGGDFRQATYRAIRQGLMSAKSVLLEPWYLMEIHLPDEYAGRCMTDIIRMGGSFEDPVSLNGETVLRVSAPVRLLKDYPRELNAFTRGRATVTMNVKGYEKCPDQDEIVSSIGYEPERDLDNPSSSVFCSHGAGTEVKWNEAPNWMHLPLLKDKKETEEAPARTVRSSFGSAVDDKQLMSIFERTYGKVERKLFDTKEIKHEVPAPTAEVIEIPKRPEYLLVDGYNVIFAWDELKEIARGSIDMARNALINLLDNHAGLRDIRVIVVFDAYKIKRNPGSEERVGNVDIVYTKEAQTADSYIEKLTYELSKLNVVRVATGDGPEQLIILGNGAYRMTTKELRDEINLSSQEIRALLDKLNTHKPSRGIETAIANAVKKKLEKQ